MLAPILARFPFVHLYTELDWLERYDEEDVKFVVGGLLSGMSIFELLKTMGQLLCYNEIQAIRKAKTFIEYRQTFSRQMSFGYHAAVIDAAASANYYLESVVADEGSTQDDRLDAAKALNAAGGRSAEALYKLQELVKLQADIDELKHAKAGV